MNTSRKFSILARIAAGFVIAAALFVAAPAASADDGAAATEPGVVKADDIDAEQAWWCTYGNPCLYDQLNGQGDVLYGLPCGDTYLENFDWRNKADSARTYANSMTVWIWNGKQWVNFGTVPPWQQWNFVSTNAIDRVTVNC